MVSGLHALTVCGIAESEIYANPKASHGEV